MPISYVYSGEPMNGTAQDDFMIAYKGSTGTDNNTINGNGGDDWVMADSSDTWIPGASYLNGSIASAFNLETLTSTWTTAENPQFGDATIPHTTVITEATIGQSEFYRVAIGAGQTITVDIDFGADSPIGVERDLVAEIQDSLGNILVTGDDSLVSDGGLGSSPSVPGAQASHDPYLTFTAPAAGIYYINVRPFGSGPGSTFTDNATFVMNLSVTGHAVAAANPVQGVDTIDGGDGDDFIAAGGGGDTVMGGLGNDTIHAGSGPDIVHGGVGDDVLYGGDGTEESIHGDEGNDTLYSGGEGHYYGDAGDDLVYSGLTAGVNEMLDGGSGIDTLDTRTWNGTYEINLVTGATNFGESFINFENVITGDGADTIVGTAGANTIDTHGGVDTVDAGGGDDTLKGGAGNDVLDGGAGNDWADYSDKTQAVSVTLAGAADATVTVNGVAEDTIRNIENVRGGSINDVLTGDGLANTLYGGAGGDLLLGQGGTDTLRGGIGQDVMDGGTGVDWADYSDLTVSVSVTLDGANDATVTVGGVAEDTVRNIERVKGGSAKDVLIGDAQSNQLYGLGGDDILRGGVGHDVLDGGTGVDTADYSDQTLALVVTLDGATTVDVEVDGVVEDSIRNIENLIGGAGTNKLTGDGLDNGLTGGAAKDTLNGGAGADTMSGGAANDTYIVDNAGDDVIEAINGGTDLVKSSVSFSLAGQHIEKLTLTGSADINGTGNSLANTMIGNSGANTLNGGTGADTMTGGADDDTYIVDNAGDVVVEAGGGGTDLVKSSVSFSLSGQQIEKLTLTTNAAIDGTGNALANTIVGNGGANVLDGSTGSDVLTGNAGADTFAFRSALGAANIDTVADFSVADDTIELDGAIFSAITGTGVLTLAQFSANATGTAQDTSDRIIYETDTGMLFYDSNGNASGGRVQFAQLDAGLALTHSDFVVT